MICSAPILHRVYIWLQKQAIVNQSSAAINVSVINEEKKIAISNFTTYIINIYILNNKGFKSNLEELQTV
jgi:hypothetical protein